MTPNAERRTTAAKRTLPNSRVWENVLDNYNHKCAWTEGGIRCPLQSGDVDPVGDGTVKLTPDHKTPHAIYDSVDEWDLAEWQPLCWRHQVMKKNY